MRRALLAAVLAAVAWAIAVPIAGAAIEVVPRSARLGTDVNFTVKVHSIRPGTVTQAVSVELPPEIQLTVIGAPPVGWSQRPIKRDGRAVGVFFHGGEIPQGTHQRFRVTGRTRGVGRTVWTAEQFYADGVVEQLSLDPTSPPTDPQETDGYGALVVIEGDGSEAQPGAAPPAASPEALPPAAPVVEIESPDDGSGLARGFGTLLLLAGLVAFGAVLVMLVRDRRSDSEGLA
jgi:uncharacterized protein YcnI